jgi:hypothetical protein
MYMLSLAKVVRNLGFVLAIDHCARGCAHCPAYGDRSPVQRAPFAELSRTVAAVAAVRRRAGVPGYGRVVHCWRISDPLDYTVRLPGGGTATCADVAGVWRAHLGQGLYVVTNGSEGRAPARRALADLVATPDLVSQVKLTITHADRSWDSAGYVADLAWDVATLAPLWQRASTRAEDPAGLRFRINVKTTEGRKDEVRARVLAVLAASGMSRPQARRICGDGQRVRFKPIYDLGNAAGGASPVAGALDVRGPDGQRYKPTAEARRRWQYGIRPDRRLFTVDMYAFTESDLGPAERPLRWPTSIDGADMDAPLDADGDG